MMHLCFITLFYLSQISYSAIFHGYLLFAGKTMRRMSTEWILSRADIRLNYFSAHVLNQGMLSEGEGSVQLTS